MNRDRRIGVAISTLALERAQYAATFAGVSLGAAIDALLRAHEREDLGVAVAGMLDEDARISAAMDSAR